MKNIDKFHVAQPPARGSVIDWYTDDLPDTYRPATTATTARLTPVQSYLLENAAANLGVSVDDLCTYIVRVGCETFFRDAYNTHIARAHGVHLHDGLLNTLFARAITAQGERAHVKIEDLTGR